MINEIGEKCTVCLKYKKAPFKAVVGSSLSRDFNDVISIDLKERDSKNIFKIWITLFGPPNQILSDNGWDFNNELLRVCQVN